ncbi:MAG: hypothetical protein mread185_000349 [Mycoplasmataceae bacterium]|nr:MAG: hypothetical protein mread185_000349 [Mycoplasmataceae bacterium]
MQSTETFQELQEAYEKFFERKLSWIDRITKDSLSKKKGG